MGSGFFEMKKTDHRLGAMHLTPILSRLKGEHLKWLWILPVPLRLPAV